MFYPRWQRLLIAFVLTSSLLLLFLFELRDTPVDKNTGITLRAPSFVKAAHAETDQRMGTAFLEEEAGISAYTEVGRSIDLAQVRQLLRGVERETSEYLIGSIQAPGYAEIADEQWDVHLYAHKDGWLVAYYLKEEVAANMFNWPDYTTAQLSQNNLSDVLKYVLSVQGIVLGSVGYYDFRYPNANTLMLIADMETRDRATDSFQLKIPSAGIVVHERSWSAASYGANSGSDCKLNGERLAEVYGNRSWVVYRGRLDAVKLPQESLHSVELHYNRFTDGQTFCGIALVYREEP
jgi:hypothetical protein